MEQTDLTGDVSDLAEEVTELEREMSQRRRVFPRLVGNGTLGSEEAARRMRVMQRTIDRLRAQL